MTAQQARGLAAKYQEPKYNNFNEIIEQIENLAAMGSLSLTTFYDVTTDCKTQLEKLGYVVNDVTADRGERGLAATKIDWDK